MTTFLVEIEWLKSSELVQLDFGSLKQGSKIQTEELWPDDTVVTYEVEVMEEPVTPVKLGGGTFQVVLRYDPDAANQSIKPTDVPEIDWGTYLLELDPASGGGTARRIRSDKQEKVEADSVRIVASSLHEKQLEVAKRVKRPGQAAVRKFLLARDKAIGCAITGEKWEGALEAAHIMGAAKGGAAHWSNCFLLRADLHRLYDAKCLQIDPDGTVSTIGAPKRGTAYRDLPKLNQAVLERVRGALTQEAERRRLSGA